MRLRFLFLSLFTIASYGCSNTSNPSIDDYQKSNGDANSSSSDQNAGLLQALPDSQIPERILECRSKGVTGSVQNGTYGCDQQGLGECGDLPLEKQEKVIDYAKKNLDGYGVFACSKESEIFYVYFFKENENKGLDIFKLEIEE
jgi:hypothetical protein